jgi:pimeloyl-ACP methyl ester carboxylesterase
MSWQKHRGDLFAQTLRLAFVKRGAGRNYLLLHAGSGAGSMMGLAEALSARGCVVVPTHPGFDGEPRPEWLTRIDELALAYLTLVERLEMKDVVVVGSSIGGWIAAEIALRKSPRVAGAVLLNAVGIDAAEPDHPMGDPRKIPPDELLARAFHDPKFAQAIMKDEATLADNQRSLLVYAGDPYMHDPRLRARLAYVSTPTLVAWGESDRLIDLDYGKRYAASIPGARFVPIAKAGHLPQIERVEETARIVMEFAERL